MTGNGALLRNKINRLKGKNYTQLREDLYKNDSESESVNNHDVRNLLKDKNDTELKKDLEYKNDSESERVWNNCLDSIKGSNKTVESPSVVLGKRKRTDQATASTFVAATADNSALEKLPSPTHESGAPASKIIPWELHLIIQEALNLRELVKLHKINREAEDKNDSESELDNDLDFQLKQCEDRIRSLAKRFKKLKQLPHDWKYDPATASTFVCAKADISALQKLSPPTHKTVRCCSQVYDPNQKFPKTTNVLLNDDERLIWSEFLDGDKDVPALGAVDLLAVDEVKRPLEIKNPIVSQIGNFAVAAFNEAVEMYVKKGEANNIHDIEIMKCKYIKMKSAYYFYITIEAIEERKHGVYEAKVDFMRKTSSKTLSHFVLTDCKPHKPPVSSVAVFRQFVDVAMSTWFSEEGMMKPKIHPGSWLDCAGIRYTGMRRRLNKSICRGYDYQDPWGMGLAFLDSVMHIPWVGSRDFGMKIGSS
ncbi:hypothetical protein Tco_0850277 [Tanacetum coccineum]